MSAISASFRGLSQQSHLLRGWSFTWQPVTIDAPCIGRVVDERGKRRGEIDLLLLLEEEDPFTKDSTGQALRHIDQAQAASVSG